MTNEIDEGGPAFPLTVVKESHGVTGAPMASDVFLGISARDYFAAAALQAMISTAAAPFLMSDPSNIEPETAKGAYKFADAMLAARRKA